MSMLKLTKRKDIVFTSGIFELDDVFRSFLNSIGYKDLTEEAREDEKVIQFIKDYGENFRGYLVYKGKPNFNFKIGFSGLAFIINVNTSKNWVLKMMNDDSDLKAISYVSVNKSSNGEIYLNSTNEYDYPLKYNILQ